MLAAVVSFGFNWYAVEVVLDAVNVLVVVVVVMLLSISGVYMVAIDVFWGGCL